MRLFITTCVLMFGIAVNNLYAALPDIDALMTKKDYLQAKESAFGILKNTKDVSQQIEARYYFGLAELRLGQYAAARNAFQIVMDAKPSELIYDQAALGIVEEYYLTGFYEESLNAVNQLLNHSPHSSFLSQIYLKIAGNDLKLMKWDEGKEYLSKVVNEFPQSPDAVIAKQLLEEKKYFSVQVGAFLSKERANTLIHDLNVRGQNAYIGEVTAASGEKFYRVRVGRVASLKAAEELEKFIAKLGYPALIYP